ncbi:hypothetical protein KIH86_12505 [Paenibacillus sp. HN-1]|nr:hypothetical protein [Paenibacillus sp. CGMCC 1.18879]MBY9085046.1 hypothetical protein [Paenibacillus sinensis]
MSSGHSNSARDMLSRLETMVLSGAELPVQVVRQQIGSAIDIIIHLARFRDRTRRVVEICEVTGMSEGEVQLNPLFEFRELGEYKGRIKGTLAPCGNPLKNTAKLEMAGVRDNPLNRFKATGVRIG